MFKYYINSFFFAMVVIYSSLTAAETMTGFTAEFLSSSSRSSGWTFSRTVASALKVEGESLNEYQNEILGIWGLDGYYRSKNLFRGMFTYAASYGGRGFAGHFWSHELSDNYSFVAIAEWFRSIGTEKSYTSYWGLTVFGQHPTTDPEWQIINPVRIYEGEILARKDTKEMNGLITIELDKTNNLARYSLDFPDLPKITFETTSSPSIKSLISHGDYKNASVKSQFYGENADEIGGVIQIAHQEGYHLTGVFALKWLLDK